MDEMVYDARKALYEKQRDDAYSAMEHLKAMGELSVSDEITRLETIKAKYAKNVDDRRDIDERLFEARNRKRTEEISEEYKQLDFKKHVGELTVEQEIEWLTRIRDYYAQTADEKMEVERRLFDARQQLLESSKRVLEEQARAEEEQARVLNKLADGVRTALRKQLEEQQKAELAYIQRSMDSWKKWEQAQVDAINAQIKALDDLTKAEDREEKDRAELKKIQATKLMYEFEHDEENKAALGKEIERLTQEREKRLKLQARDDQKIALKSQIDDVKTAAQAEREALQSRQESIREFYAKRMEQAVLNAEAEKVLANSTQQEIVDLIGRFAPDYDATGQTLGERMLEGFKARFGGILDYVAGINAQIAGMQSQMVSAVSAYGIPSMQSTQSAPTSISRSVDVGGINIYSPVQSPLEYRRETEAMAQRLVDMYGR